MRGDARQWRDWLILGLLNNAIPFSLIFWGQTRIGAGLAAILNATSPVFGVLVAHAAGTEPARARRAAGVLVGVAGVAVMLAPAVAAQGLSGDVPAMAASLLAAVTYALAAQYGRRFGTRPPLETACAQLTASSGLMLPVALIVERPWALPMPSAGALGAVVALALASTAVAYVLYFRILAAGGAVNVLLVTFLVPVSAIWLGAAVLGESITAAQLAGMALIGAALAAIDGRLVARLRR